MKPYLKPIAELKACLEALDWAEQYASLDEAWRKCRRGDWMLWLIGKTIAKVADRKPLVLVACECARLALPYIPKGEERPLKAIETAEAWVRGKATIKEVRAAVSAAAYAASTAASAAAYAASTAVSAAAYAASTAVSAASTAASAAAYAASMAAYAASTAASAAAYAATLSRCADIVRKHYPKPPKVKRI